MCFLNRDGGVDEGRGQHGRGAHSGGEEPTISGLQERDRGSESLLEDNQQHRTEGREQGRRGEAEDDPGIQTNGKLPPNVQDVTCVVLRSTFKDSLRPIVPI